MIGKLALNSPVTRPWLGFAVLAAATATGISGVEMVLPVLPVLPSALAGSAEQAQLVIAAYVGGGALGAACYGELGARLDSRRVLAFSLLTYAGLALLAATAQSLPYLILVRLAQGAIGTAALVFAPGMIRSLFPGEAAVGAMGRVGGITAGAALVWPVVGDYVAGRFGWRAVLGLPGMLALITGLAVMTYQEALPRFVPVKLGAFWRLFRRPVLLRYVLNQALAQTAVLAFAFGAPVVLAGSQALGTSQFVLLRVGGMGIYILATVAAWRISRRLGADRALLLATALAATAAAGAGIALLAGAGTFATLLPCWLVVSASQGTREPVGQLRVVEASGDDPARAVALAVLLWLGLASTLTATTAPLVQAGPLPLVLASLTVWCLSLGALFIRGG